MWQQLQKKYLGATIPLINVHGTITSATRLRQINPSRASALAVSVNSGGGYPVQSQLIANKIKDFARKHNLKLFMFARDLAASGGYFILCTGDHVYADKTSLVGNIGVIYPKTKLKGLLDIISIENKQLSSNQNCMQHVLNPFSDITDSQRQQITQLCSNMHEKFIKHVRNSRKIKESGGQIFSGQLYTGQEAQKNGLIDETGSMVEILEKNFPGSKIQCEKPQRAITNFMSKYI